MKNKTKKMFEEDYFFGRLGSYVGGYGRLNYRRKFLAFVLNKKFGLEGKRVLDVGCATGSLVLFFGRRGIDALGIDVSKWAIKHSVSSNLIRCDAEYLPFKKASFDVIIAREVVEHLPNALRFLKTSRCIIKEGGILLISTPNGKDMREADQTHINVKTHEEWINILSNIGFLARSEPLFRMPEKISYLLERLLRGHLMSFYRFWIFGKKCKLANSF